MSDKTTSIIQGKNVILALRHDDEERAISTMLDAMGLNVHRATGGRDVVISLEDDHYDLLVMDIQLPDMHGWTMLGTLKERLNLTELPIVVIMDEAFVVPIASVTAVVRPVAMARLRYVIWNLLKDRFNGMD